MTTEEKRKHRRIFIANRVGQNHLFSMPMFTLAELIQMVRMDEIIEFGKSLNIYKKG